MPVASPSRPIRRAWRFALNTLWFGFVTLVVLAAVALSVARLVIPEVAAYREQVAQWASDWLGQPVQITAMDARLSGLRPTLVFQDVRLLDAAGEEALAGFTEARVQLAPLASLRAGRPIPAGLILAGAELAVTRQADGRLLVQGLDAPRETGMGEGNLAEWLLSRDYLAFEDSTLVWTDLGHSGEPLRFSVVNLRLRNAGSRHQLDGTLRLPTSLGEELRLALDAQGPAALPSSWNGQFYLQGTGLRIEQWLERLPRSGLPALAGHLEAELWGSWGADGLERLTGTLRGEKLRMTQVGHSVALDAAGGAFGWEKGAHRDWELTVQDLRLMRAGERVPSRRVQVRRRDDAWQVQADGLELAPLRDLVLASGLLPETRSQQLHALAPEGELRGLDLQLDPDRNGYRLQANFERLGWGAVERWPGLRGASGRVRLDQNGGHLWLEEVQGTVEHPSLFRGPLPIAGAAGSVQWQLGEAGWQLSAPALHLRTPEAEAQATLLLMGGAGKRPFLDLQARVGTAPVSAIPAYLPAGIIPDEVVAWLDKALLDGRIEEAGVVYHGPIAPRALGDGRAQLAVELDIDRLDLQYRPDWPRLEAAQASARFTGIGMQVNVKQGRLAGSRVGPGTVVISDFSEPFLAIESVARGEAERLLGFVRQSPLGRGREVLRDLHPEGPGVVRLRLGVPLLDRVAARRALQYAGTVEFTDGALRLLERRLDITGIRGRFEFDDEGYRASGVRARILGGEATLDVDSAPAGSDGDRLIIRGKGRLAGTELARRFQVPALDRIGGASDWWGQLTLSPAPDEPLVHLQLSSELIGMQLDGPLPVHKPAAQPLALSAVWRTQHNGARILEAALGDRLAVGLAWAEGAPRPARIAVHFGDGPAPLPLQPGVRVTGVLQTGALGTWRGLLGGAGGTDWQLPIELDLARVELAAPEPAAVPAPALPGDAPDWAALPSVRGRIGALVYAGRPLGRAEFTLVSLPSGGLRLERLGLDSERLRLTATGQWQPRALGSRTRVTVTATTSDAGAALRDLGFASVIRGGAGKMDAALEWSGAPQDVELSRLSGTAQLYLADGAIEEVRPGAGRLLGLFSLQALPRRLMLDFRDVFDKGFGFDEMSGSFRLDDGAAYTDDLRLAGTAAHIRVQGRTGIAMRDYDHLIAVTPRLGDSLPVAGGLAWGPQVGALILLFQKIFKSQIDRAAEIRYRVTGSWEAPHVELLEPKQRD